VGLCVGDGVDEAGVDAWGGEDGGMGEAEDGGFEGGSGHGVAEEELQGEVGGVVIVEVGVDFVVVAVCLVGFFVGTVGPFYADLAGETFPADLDAGEGKEEFGAPGSRFTCRGADYKPSGCAPAFFASRFEDSEVAGSEQLARTHGLHCGSFELLEDLDGAVEEKSLGGLVQWPGFAPLYSIKVGFGNVHELS